MIDWTKLDKVTIFNEKDENGNRYLAQFLRDYKNTFDLVDINASCERCLNDYYTNFIKYLNKMENKNKECAYKLKTKYSGIQKEFGSNVFVTNENLTDEVAEFLLENHARGKELFSEMPDNAPEPKEKTDADLTLKALKEKYPEVQPSTKKATFLERVAEWKASQEDN